MLNLHRESVKSWLSRALFIDLATVVFIMGGWVGLLFLMHFPSQYYLWKYAIVFLPASYLGNIVWNLFKLAYTKWANLKPAFVIEARIATMLITPLLLIGVSLLLNSSLIGWYVFALSGTTSSFAFLLAWRRILPPHEGRVPIDTGFSFVQ